MHNEICGFPSGSLMKSHRHILILSFIDPEWLSISHTTGLLLPNELIEITLTAFIDSTIASRTNLGPRNLDCTLIMHTIMGKDYFIAVSANYRKILRTRYNSC